MNGVRAPSAMELQLITSYVRAGAFPQVAAQAAGVPVELFDQWMRFGKAKRPVAVYRQFRNEVLTAHAMARVAAESRTLERHSLSWLRYGPGRESKRLIGWTSPPRAPVVVRKKGATLEKWQGVFALLLDTLRPYPEIRATLAEALMREEMLTSEDEEGPDGESASNEAVEGGAGETTWQPEGEQSATEVQASCNEPALEVQPERNEPATEMQQECNRNAQDLQRERKDRQEERGGERAQSDAPPGEAEPRDVHSQAEPGNEGGRRQPWKGALLQVLILVAVACVSAMGRLLGEYTEPARTESCQGNREVAMESAVLTGRWVRLEPLEENHREPLRTAADDERIWIHTLVDARGAGFDRWFEEAINQRSAGRQVPYAVRRQVDQALVGSTSYLDAVPRHRRVEIGSTWYNPAAWATEVNPECKLLLLAHAFEVLRMNRVSFCTDARNTRSQAAIEKLGAVKEGVLRCHMVTQGERLRDSVLYSIVASDWERVKARLMARLDGGGRRPDAAP